jgi:hypothetical protein
MTRQSTDGGGSATIKREAVAAVTNGPDDSTINWWRRRMGRYDRTMVGIRRRRFGSNDSVAVMGGSSRQMRQYGIAILITQYGTILQYGMVILQYLELYRLGVARPFLMLKALFLTLPWK